MTKAQDRKALIKKTEALLRTIAESEESAQTLLVRMAKCGCEQVISADEACLSTGEPQYLWCWPCQAQHVLDQIEGADTLSHIHSVEKQLKRLRDEQW